MELFLNGKKRNLNKDVFTVKDLMKAFLLNEKGVIIELNGKIIPNELRTEIKLKDGDRVEVIQFMGGG